MGFTFCLGNGICAAEIPKKYRGVWSNRNCELPKSESEVGESPYLVVSVQGTKAHEESCSIRDISRITGGTGDSLTFSCTGEAEEWDTLKGVSQFDIRSIDNFASDLQKPDYTEFYTFIEPNFGKSFFARQPWQKGIAREDLAGPTYKGGSSQHPEDDPSGGEGLIKAVYEAIRRSPVWNTSLLVIVYDEHGGFYDSVKPGRAVPPGDLPPRGQPALNSRGFDFSHYGVRVPAVVVSPLIPKGKVDPTVYDRASSAAPCRATAPGWRGSKRGHRR